MSRAPPGKGVCLELESATERLNFRVRPGVWAMSTKAAKFGMLLNQVRMWVEREPPAGPIRPGREGLRELARSP